MFLISSGNSKNRKDDGDLRMILRPRTLDETEKTSTLLVVFQVPFETSDRRSPGLEVGCPEVSPIIVALTCKLVSNQVLTVVNCKILTARRESLVDAFEFGIVVVV